MPNPLNAGFACAWVVTVDPNGDATAVVVVAVPKPPLVPNGEPNPPKPVLAWVVAGVAEPKIDVVADVAAGVLAKLKLDVGAVVVVVPKPPKPAGFACCPNIEDAF